MRSFVFVLVGALVVFACEPSDEAYTSAARAIVESGCCTIDGPRCAKCALLEHARVTSAVATACCAGSGKLVSIEFEGPNGPGTCTFNAMKHSGSIDVNMGSCRAR